MRIPTTPAPVDHGLAGPTPTSSAEAVEIAFGDIIGAMHGNADAETPPPPVAVEEVESETVPPESDAEVSFEAEEVDPPEILPEDALPAPPSQTRNADALGAATPAAEVRRNAPVLIPGVAPIAARPGGAPAATEAVGAPEPTSAGAAAEMPVAPAAATKPAGSVAGAPIILPADANSPPIEVHQAGTEPLGQAEQIADPTATRSTEPQRLTGLPAQNAQLSAAGLRQIAEMLSTRPDAPVEITMNPEELGRVRIALTQVDGGLSVSILADQAQTLELFRRHAGELQQELAAMGFAGATFDFGQDGRNQTTERTDPAHLMDIDPADTALLVDLDLLPRDGLDIRL